MNIVYNKFQSTLIEKYNIGSGIIPISIDDTGNIRILLAKERYSPNWKGSNRWSGFEGGKKNLETCIETALREFNEESLGVVQTFRDMKDSLVNYEYNYRFVVNIHQDKLLNKFHTTYIVQVPWQPNCINDFKQVKDRLLNIHTCNKLLQCINSMIGKYKIGGNFCFNDISGTLSGIKNVSKVNNTIKVIIKIDNKEHIIYDDSCDYLLFWKPAVEILTSMVKDFNHPCLTIIKDCYGNIYNVIVKDDYLEKECMKWWTIKDLKEVCKNGGTCENESFKCFFMPVIKTLLDELDSLN
tara:strand:+ start:124 stop:1014 length:891 start_codon:yes stop_codon:yes gene_type:complete